MTFNPQNLAWKKMNGLLPAIVQNETGQVLMLAYMNQAALEQTLQTGWVTFYSRSKNKLWVKGETSGNKLKLVNISTDCDQDTLLITAHPLGPVCHQGSLACFNTNESFSRIIEKLESIIDERKQSRPLNSYTTDLFNAGTNKISQKVGEECIELIIAALNESNDRVKEEAADLFFHFLVLLKEKDIRFEQVVSILQNRLISQTKIGFDMRHVMRYEGGQF